MPRAKTALKKRVLIGAPGSERGQFLSPQDAAFYYPACTSEAISEGVEKFAEKWSRCKY